MLAGSDFSAGPDAISRAMTVLRPQHRSHPFGMPPGRGPNLAFVYEQEPRALPRAVRAGVAQSLVGVWIESNGALQPRALVVTARAELPACSFGGNLLAWRAGRR